MVAHPASSQCQDDMRVLLEIFSHLHARSGGGKQARVPSNLPNLSWDRTRHRTNGSTSSSGEDNRAPSSPHAMAAPQVLPKEGP